MRFIKTALTIALCSMSLPLFAQASVTQAATKLHTWKISSVYSSEDYRRIVLTLEREDGRNFMVAPSSWQKTELANFCDLDGSGELEKMKGKTFMSVKDNGIAAFSLYVVNIAHGGKY